MEQNRFTGEPSFVGRLEFGEIPTAPYRGGSPVLKSQFGQECKQIGRATLHVDVNAVTFPSAHRLFVGTDGGVWETTDFTLNPVVWTSRNYNLANIEFYRGAVARLNYGLSVGGTQDNGTLKGGNPPQWFGLGGGDDAAVIIDPRNSNNAFFTDIGGVDLRRTLDGFATQVSGMTSGLPTPVDLQYHSLTMHPNDSNTLAVYSFNSSQVFRTTNALASQPTWTDITTDTPLLGDVLPDLHALTISPSGIYFGGACNTFDDRGIWRMVTLGTWEQKGKLSLPEGCISSIAQDTSQSCTSTSCNLYLGLTNFSAPGNVFRSCNAGQTWINISGTGSTGLPVLPATRVVVHPTNPNVIYVATDMGVFQGTFSGNIATCPQVGTWTWGTFTNGMPPTARVFDLGAHPDPVLLRAWTYGRGVWETQLANPNPDFKINTTQAPVTGTLHNSVRISSGTAVGTGNRFGVGWADDRLGANNWHVYFRGYSYDVSNNPLALGNDFKVDDSSTHVAQVPALSAHPSSTTSPYCARLAWADDRQKLGVNRHIYFQHVCSDTFRQFVNDVQADQHLINIDAANPAISFKPNLETAITWEVERTDFNPLHDIYARLFTSAGAPKGNAFKINTSTLDATMPAIVANQSNEVFIAWEEFDSSPGVTNGKIMISKYNNSGVKTAGPTQVDNNGITATERHDVSLAIDNSGNVIVAWWEAKSDGSELEAVFKRRMSTSLGFVENQQPVSQAPGQPAAARRALRVSVDTESGGRSAITWWANFNDEFDNTGNIFARSYTSTAGTLKNDFRVDLAPRTGLPLHPRVARSTLARFVYAWRDNRNGPYDVYGRVVAAP